MPPPGWFESVTLVLCRPGLQRPPLAARGAGHRGGARLPAQCRGGERARGGGGRHEEQLLLSLGGDAAAGREHEDDGEEGVAGDHGDGGGDGGEAGATLLLLLVLAPHTFNCPPPRSCRATAVSRAETRGLVM